jgi:hypothetical protein
MVAPYSRQVSAPDDDPEVGVRVAVAPQDPVERDIARPLETGKPGEPRTVKQDTAARPTGPDDMPVLPSSQHHEIEDRPLG